MTLNPRQRIDDSLDIVLPSGRTVREAANLWAAEDAALREALEHAGGEDLDALARDFIAKQGR